MPLPVPGEAVPSGLRTAEFAMRPITVDDAAADYDAVMATRDLLREWEQTGWPADDFTVEANRADLEGLARRHEEGRAFTFTIRDPDDVACLGCVYVFPTEAAFLAAAHVSPLNDETWEDVDAVVYFWVRAAPSNARPLDAQLLSALRSWFREDWSLHSTVYVTSELVTHQLAVLDASGLTPLFELREEGKPARYLAYG